MYRERLQRPEVGEAPLGMLSKDVELFIESVELLFETSKQYSPSGPKSHCNLVPAVGGVKSLADESVVGLPTQYLPFWPILQSSVSVRFPLASPEVEFMLLWCEPGLDRSKVDRLAMTVPLRASVKFVRPVLGSIADPEVTFVIPAVRLSPSKVSTSSGEVVFNPTVPFTTLEDELVG